MIVSLKYCSWEFGVVGLVDGAYSTQQKVWAASEKPAFDCFEFASGDVTRLLLHPKDEC